MKLTKIFLVFIFSIFLLTACQSNENLDKSLAYEKEDFTPKNGGEISISMVRFDTLNPILNKEKSVDEVLKLVYDPLFEIDENNNVIPKMVDSYVVSGDNLSIHIKLKDNILWHDGQKCTSDDVKFTVSYIKEHKDSPYYYLVENISSVEIDSDTEFDIIYLNPYAFSLDSLIFPVVPKHKVANVRDEASKEDTNNLIGSGMYKIAKYDKRKCLYLQKNENYYDKKPYIDKINVLIVPDQETQENMLISQDIDIARVNDAMSSKFNTKKFHKQGYSSRNFEFIAMNFDNKFIQDINFRRALSHCIDFQKILNDVYMKNGEISMFPLSKKSNYYNKDINLYKYDIKMAKNYISKVSMKDELKDYRFQMIVNQNDYMKLKTAYMLKQKFQEIGIVCDVIELAPEDYINSLESGQYDFAICSWSIPLINDPSFLFYEGSNFKSNFMNYKDNELDLLVSNLLNSSHENIKKNYDLVQKNVHENIPFIGLVMQNQYIMLNNDVKGTLKSNNFDIYNGIENLFVKY